MNRLNSSAKTFTVMLLLQLVVYAGPTTSSRKIAEYGGNTLGYGSRSVLGSGWPKDLVKVITKIVVIFCTDKT